MLQPSYQLVQSWGMVVDEPPDTDAFTQRITVLKLIRFGFETETWPFLGALGRLPEPGVSPKPDERLYNRS